MNEKQLEAAQEIGVNTPQELHIFNMGILYGRKEAYDEVVADLKGEPDYSELKAEYDSEETQERIEEKEHYADYSDQREGE